MIGMFVDTRRNMHEGKGTYAIETRGNKVAVADGPK